MKDVGRMQDAIAGLSCLIVQQRRPTPDAFSQLTSVHEARAFVLSADALLRPRPVLCPWFADTCIEHAPFLPDHVRFMAVAVVLSCAAELPLSLLDSVTSLLPQHVQPSRDLLAVLHWRCIISVAAVVCLQQQSPHANAVTVLCQHASDCALAASVSEAINAAVVAHRSAPNILRPPSAAVFDWARVLITQAEDRARLLAWLVRCSSSDDNCQCVNDAAGASCFEHGQTSAHIINSSPIPLLQAVSVVDSLSVSTDVRADIVNALRCSPHSLCTVAMSHRATCTMRHFFTTLCECLDADTEIQPFDVYSCCPSILELVQLVHDTTSPECLSITMPLARTLAARFGCTVDVWMCVHRCMLCPAAGGSMEVSGADVGAMLAPPEPLARFTLLPGPADASLHACWGFACACMQLQLHEDLDLLPSTLTCLARSCDAAAVAAALFCRAGQWLCMCCSDGASDKSVSRCIDVAMMTLQVLASLTSTPCMMFLSHVHSAWRATVAIACESDDALLDCVPPYLLLISHAAGRVAFSSAYGPNIANDVIALITAAFDLVPRLRQLLSGWLARCGSHGADGLFNALRDAGVVSSAVSRIALDDLHQDASSQPLDMIDNNCPTTPRSDGAGASFAYRLASLHSPSQKSPAAASPLHKSTETVLDRVLQRFSDDPSSLSADAIKFSRQVKSLDAWRHLVAAVAAPQSSTWAAANVTTRCRFVHALINGSLPGADAAVPHLTAWIVGGDRRVDGDVLQSIVTTWTRSSMLVDSNAFCVWVLRQAQALPGVMSSFQSLHGATVILQPMLNVPSMLSVMAAQLISRAASVPAAGRMLALVFASGYSLDALLPHHTKLSFGHFDESRNSVGGSSAAAALNSDPFCYLCMHGVAGAALMCLHEAESVASLLRTCSPEIRRKVTHSTCFHVLRCLSLPLHSLNRCNIRALLSLASEMTRDLTFEAESPENVAAAHRLLTMCGVLQPLQARYGEEAVQLLRCSRCDLARTSVDHICSSFFSDSALFACAQGLMSSVWDAAWLASLSAACGHKWELAGAERVLSLLGLQLQFGCAPDVGVCANMPDNLMLHAAILLMQQPQCGDSFQLCRDHIASIALQLFCRRASFVPCAFTGTTADGLHITASLASLCASCSKSPGSEQLSLLVCLVSCALIQQLKLENLDPCICVTKIFDEHSSESCWRGLCLAASRANLALAAAAGFSSGAVLISQLLHIGAPFATALPLLQSAPAYAFAAFSLQFDREQKVCSPIVKIERFQDDQSRANVKGAELRSSFLSAAVLAPMAAFTDDAKSSDIDRSADSCISQTKRQLVAHCSVDRSAVLDVGAIDLIALDADTSCKDNAPAFASQLPKKRQAPSPRAGKHQFSRHAPPKDPAKELSAGQDDFSIELTAEDNSDNDVVALTE